MTVINNVLCITYKNHLYATILHVLYLDGMKELMPSQECRVMGEFKSDDAQVIDSDIGQGHNVKIFCNGKIFAIAIFPTGPPDY